ncbi:MAG TPA: zinc ABC transporter substrate-binding protein [Candidatus Sulfotelmatobacter sp.]|nr:zinc ABC transporter substrate-binding protein [Candidatus Sulfotelmatobacter sp.]
MVVAAACGQPTAGGSSSISVVAGENFWGSIAAQLGGTKASVQSVVTDPNADPHEYESSAADARAFANAGLVVLNGAGYDDWGQKLLDANPSSGRRVVKVAEVLGKKQGDNPHFWYDPGSIATVADRITSEYRSIDPADSGYFDEQRSRLQVLMGPYLSEVATIRKNDAGRPIGATESIFVYMASALGLDLVTPPAFMDAVAEGNDPPASAVAIFQDQVSRNEIKVLVYNVQTTTQVTTNIKDLATAHHIPSVGVSETMQPENGTFQDWQLNQLKSLERALQSTG